MATIKDIAKKAGVSVATVSRAMNNKKDISDEMRKYILKIVDDMGYVPNSMAKNLSHGRTNLIAVMLPTLNNQFFSDLLNEIEGEANRHGYNTLFFNSSDDRKKVEYYLNSMRSNFVCGAIINSLSVSGKDLENLEKNGIKTITIDRSGTDPHYSSVMVNHRTGGQLATEHLFAQGCKKPVMLSGAPDDRIANERKAGFIDVVERHTGSKDITLIHSDLTSRGGYEHFLNFIKKNESFDGVFCSNDAMAFGAMRACADSGIKVPDDCLIVGYDNSSMDEMYIPRLSSVDQNLNMIGKLSIETMIKLINGKTEVEHLCITPELVARESTIKRE
ncbi:LacI family transcriptional regulator [Salmonella enterica subsp. enterica serovar Choleraesuis]|nr:LacI family transcriptional regulator [Salmonella enterica subsp. enterica serovar Choleraesuis]